VVNALNAAQDLLVEFLSVDRIVKIPDPPIPSLSLTGGYQRGETFCFSLLIPFSYRGSDCQGRLSSHLQTSAVTDVCTPPHRLLMWHGSRPKGTKGLLEGSGVRVRVWWNQEGLQTSYQDR
jgi:hypothetical protein